MAYSRECNATYSRKKLAKMIRNYLFVLILLTKRSESWQQPSLLQKPTPFLHRRMQLFSASSSDDEEISYTIQVSYEGMSCELSVRRNETILAAMERNRVPDRLAIPEVPSECRRGNCMTCAGRHAENSRQSSLQRGEDGLSPHVSREVANRGYILTCSSHVVGDGLKLELGENHNVWDDIYRGRLVDDTAQFVGRAAMAKVIRESDERNIKRWADETEAALKKSGDKQE